MSSVAFAAPILSGKLETWKSFTREMNGPRRQEYEAHRKRAGIVHERVWHQHTPDGDMAIIYQEGDEKAMEKIATSNDPFDVWFRQQVQDIHGIDFNNLPPGPLSEQILDVGD